MLSTLHTNDAPSTITRLLNMGVEPFLVTASVNAVRGPASGAEDLRQLQDSPTDTPKDELRSLGAKDEEIDTATCFKGAGCERCNSTGYKGRIAVYEVMTFNEPLRELVLQGASSVELKAEAIRQGMRTLRMSGITKVCQGVTTFDEVGRITAVGLGESARGTGRIRTWPRAPRAESTCSNCSRRWWRRARPICT